MHLVIHFWGKKMETYFRSNGDQHEQSITTVKMIST
jgi:hypothetical protein